MHLVSPISRSGSCFSRSWADCWERFEPHNHISNSHVVTLSSSAKGIQARLSKLEKYWSDWCLNIQKTKEMIFNIAGRNITQNLMFQNNMIDCVSSYKYLAVHLTVSGSFNEARSERNKMR